MLIIQLIKGEKPSLKWTSCTHKTLDNKFESVKMDSNFILKRGNQQWEGMAGDWLVVDEKNNVQIMQHTVYVNQFKTI